VRCARYGDEPERASANSPHGDEVRGRSPPVGSVRALGIDLGSRRIGVALSDTGGLVATPYEVVERTGDAERDRRALLALADEAEVEVIVVGLPLSMDGSVGPAARAALAEVDALRAAARVPIETYDERLTTVTADRTLQELDLRGPARRRVIDKVAAAVMLQAWLDGRRAAHRPGAEPPAPPEPDSTTTETMREPTRPEPTASRRSRRRSRRGRR
jgi:putative Holliday junction resolvase